MKAQVWQGVEAMAMTDVDVPDPQEGEVLLKVGTCGICGTDVHIYDGTMTYAIPPVILGHEFAGEIAEVGKGVTGLRVGDVVAMDPNVPCNQCYHCRRALPNMCENARAYGVNRNGGFAEYCVVPAPAVVKLPEGVSAREGSFVEPLSCVAHAFQKVRVEPDHTVLITGMGTIGLLALQVARACGAARIIVTDLRDGNLTLATTLGADYTINPKAGGDLSEEITNLTNGRGADVGMDAAGATSAIELLVNVAAKGGTVVIFGNVPEGTSVKVDPVRVLRSELTIVGSWLNPYSVQYAAELLGSKKVRVEPLITNVHPLEHLVRGIEEVCQHKDGEVKHTVVMAC